MSLRTRTWSDLLGSYLSASQNLSELGLTLDSTESEVESALRKFEAEVGEHQDYIDHAFWDDEERETLTGLRDEAFTRMARGLLADARKEIEA